MLFLWDGSVFLKKSIFSGGNCLCLIYIIYCLYTSSLHKVIQVQEADIDQQPSMLAHHSCRMGRI